MKYEVWHSRHDIRPSLYTSFEADSDQEAIMKFAEIKHHPSLTWDWVKLVEVVQPRIERFVDNNQKKTS